MLDESLYIISAGAVCLAALVPIKKPEFRHNLAVIIIVDCMLVLLGYFHVTYIPDIGVLIVNETVLMVSLGLFYALLEQAAVSIRRKKSRIYTGKRMKSRRLKHPAIFAALFILFAAAGITAAVNIVFAQSNYTQAQAEYAQLRKLAPTAIAVSYDASDFGVSSASPVEASFPGALDSPSASAQGERPNRAQVSSGTEDNEPQTELTEINSDYVGWLRVDSTEIDYPVVKGPDNDRYLDTTFTGEKNASGAIFMDCRCAEDLIRLLLLFTGTT